MLITKIHGRDFTYSRDELLYMTEVINRDAYRLNDIQLIGSETVDRVVDVGAGSGDFARHCIERWQCQVLSIEPEPNLYQNLAINANATQGHFTEWGAVTVVSEKQKHAELYSSVSGSAIRGAISSAVLSPVERAELSPAFYEVPVIDITKAIKNSFGDLDITLLKTNANGSDTDVLMQLKQAGILQRCAYVRVMASGGAAYGNATAILSASHKIKSVHNSRLQLWLIAASLF